MRCLRGNGLVSEAGGKEAAGGEQRSRPAVLDDPAFVQDDGAIGDADRREPLGGDEQVRPATAGRRFSTSRRSVSVSTADIGSSGTRTRAPASSARARATRCRWPPERFTPRSPIRVS